MYSWLIANLTTPYEKDILNLSSSLFMVHAYTHMKRNQCKLDYIYHLGSLPYLCTKNETMAPPHVVTLTVQREQPKMRLYLASRVSICTKNKP